MKLVLNFHSWGQPKLNVKLIQDIDDFERSLVLVVELSGWSLMLHILSTQPLQVAYSVDSSWGAMAVHIFFLFALGSSDFSCAGVVDSSHAFHKGIDIPSFGSCLYLSQRHSWMVAKCRKEWSKAYRCGSLVIGCKFSSGKPFCPVILEVVDILSQVYFELLIHVL
jgi:hypothetical protein